jgi:hypothetical protein
MLKTVMLPNSIATRFYKSENKSKIFLCAYPNVVCDLKISSACCEVENRELHNIRENFTEISLKYRWRTEPFSQFIKHRRQKLTDFIRESDVKIAFSDFVPGTWRLCVSHEA